MTPAALVASWVQASRDIRAGFALIDEATERLNLAYTEGGNRAVGIQTHAEYVRWSEPEYHLTGMRRELWRVLVERLEIRRFMSVKAWEELTKEIAKGECPDITEEAVSAMVAQFSDRASAMLEDAVCEVFNVLRPPNSRYTRNSEYEVPRRVALTWILDSWHAKSFGASPLRPRYESEQTLTALENVFTSLDGKGSVTKGHVSALSEAIRRTMRGELGATEYFEFRGYANGALHLTFLRADLLARFNQIAGGKRLRSG